MAGRNGYDAIGDALKFYMGLRADKMERERVAANDKLNRDKFQFEQQQHRDSVRLSEEDNKHQRLGLIKTALDAQPGRVIQPGAFADEVKASPYASLLEEVPPQIASRSFGSAGERSNPSAPGGFEIQPTEDSAYRRAILNGNNAMMRTQAGIQSREGIAEAGRLLRARQFASSMGLRWEALNQQQQQHLDRLMQQREFQQAQVENWNIDNQAAFERPPAGGNNIFSLLPGLGGGIPDQTPPQAPRRTPPPRITLGPKWELLQEP